MDIDKYLVFFVI